MQRSRQSMDHASSRDPDALQERINLLVAQQQETSQRMDAKDAEIAVRVIHKCAVVLQSRQPDMSIHRHETFRQVVSG